MKPEEVATQQDFARFLRSLSHEASGFPNYRLEVFLEAASGWVEDMGGYRENIDRSLPSEPSWRLFAEILAAASVYD